MVFQLLKTYKAAIEPTILRIPRDLKGRKRESSSYFRIVTIPGKSLG